MCTAITTLGLMDSSAGSLYQFLYVVALIYAGTAYPPRGVLVIGTVATVGFAVLALAHHMELASAVLTGGMLVIAAGVGASVAHNYWRADRRRRSDDHRFEALSATHLTR